VKAGSAPRNIIALEQAKVNSENKQNFGKNIDFFVKDFLKKNLTLTRKCGIIRRGSADRAPKKLTNYS
jgi:hypothetical protein